LKPGVRQQQLRDELQVREKEFRGVFRGAMEDSESIGLRSVVQIRTGNVRVALLLLLGASGLVLLIACANVANLLLARSSARAREFSIRAALGATRKRIMRQVLTEGLVLSITASLLGLLVAAWGLCALLKFVPEAVPRANEISIDWRVIGATLTLSVLTTLVFALAPALGVSRPALADTLRDSRGTSAGKGRRRVRNALVVAEIGLCTVLLIGSTLLIRSFLNLRSATPGFDPAPLLTFKMSMPENDARDPTVREAFYRRLVERIEAIPGVEAASATTELPLNGGPDLPAEIDGRQGEESPIVQWQAITPGIFRAIGVPLKRGRVYDNRDTAGGAPVVIVNEAFVRAFQLESDPLEKRILIARVMGPKWAEGPRTIVGVVGDVKTYGLHGPARPTVYLPLSQVRYITNPGSWVVRVSGKTAGLPKLIQQEVQKVDPLLPVSQFRMMEEIIDRGISQRRFSMLLLSLLGGLALVLAVVGIYGVTSYSVAQRTHEIGIRMALGAAAADALRMVLRESLLLGSTGVLLGVAGSLALTRLLQGLLFGISSSDPTTFAATAVCLVGVALVATAIPARRAAVIDPIQALRYD
jgi:putative ABC transport system permease protein